MSRVDLGEGGAGAVGHEDQPVAWSGAVAGEVQDDIASSLPLFKDECVVAGAAHEPVGSTTAIDNVASAVASDQVRKVVAVALKVRVALQKQILDIRSQSVMSGGIDCIGSLA